MPSTDLNAAAKQISERRAESAKRRRELELFDAITEGMEMILAQLDEMISTAEGEEPNFTPPNPNEEHNSPATQSKRGGRQLGAISQTWRAILRECYEEGKTFSSSDLVGIADGHNLKISAKNAQAQMTKYSVLGYIGVLGPDRWRVTDSAARRFGFYAKNDSGPA